MRLRTLAIVISMTAGASAWAEAPPSAKPAEPAATPAAAWDDSHMQSRYQETPRAKRPLITGESGYGALASGSAATSSDAVSEEIEYTSQRQWIQGSLSRSTGSGTTSGATTQSRALGRVHHEGRNGTRGGSQLRRGSVHSNRR